MRRVDHLIVGGGMTGSAALMALAEHAPNARTALISREPHPPYERPPLSKGLWREAEPDLDEIMHDADLFGAAELVLGREAVGVDPDAHEVVDDRGETWRYGNLLLATGARVRRPPFGNGIVRTFRTREDFERLHADVQPGTRVVLVGAGFIGSELAAALRGRGARVAMVFPEGDVCALNLPAPLARSVGERYRREGIEVLAGRTIEAVERAGRDGVQHVRTTDGDALDADVVVAGLGVIPDTMLAEAAGIEVDDGIVVDAYMRTSATDVFAAGDVARFPAPALGPMRVEHEDHAKTQGFLAGANLAGAEERYDHLPMFYSDLFDWGYEAVGRLDARMDVVLVGFGLDAPRRVPGGATAAGGGGGGGMGAAPAVAAAQRTVGAHVTPSRAPVTVDGAAAGIAYFGAGERVQGVLAWNLFGKIEEARALIRARRTFDADGLARAIALAE